jgi:CRISPR/Cas system-associated protein Cas5 (RAMP superfamily)
MLELGYLVEPTRYIIFNFYLSNIWKLKTLEKDKKIYNCINKFVKRKRLQGSHDVHSGNDQQNWYAHQKENLSKKYLAGLKS